MGTRVHYITPVAPKQAQGQLRAVYEQIHQGFGLVPEPFTLHSPVPALLAGFWQALRTSLLAGTAARGAKEAVAAAVSDLNRCPWCVDAHTTMLYATGHQRVAHAILSGGGEHPSRAGDLRAITDWAYATRTPGASVLAHPPFRGEEAGEFLGTALAFHYLNRMVSIFLTETFLPTQPWLRAASRRLGGWLFAGVGRRTSAAPASEGPFALPAELDWMAEWPTVAQAFASWGAIVEDMGTQALPEPVRTLLDRRVGEWNGGEPGISRRWVEEALTPLTDAERAVGRVALLSALAPYQMDDATMQAYLALQPDQGMVVGAVAWASWRAMRRIGGWLYPRESVARG